MYPSVHHNQYIAILVVTFSHWVNYSPIIVTLPSPLWYRESRQLFGIYRQWGRTTVVTCYANIIMFFWISKYHNYIFVAGPRIELGCTGLWDLAGYLTSPQYGVIDEIRTRSILAPQASVLPYEHQSQSQVLESNQSKRFCRPSPNLSANLTCLFTFVRCSRTVNKKFLWTVRSLKDSNLYQNIRSVSCYPLHQETVVTSIESFCCVSNFYTLFLLRFSRYHVVLRASLMGDNHNTNFHSFCYIWSNSCRLRSFVLLFLLCFSFYISLTNACHISFS